MKHYLTITFAVLLALSLQANAYERVKTPATEIVLEADAGKPLRIHYYGPHLADADIESLVASGSLNCDAYPAYGMGKDNGCKALSVVHSDGSLATELRVAESYRESESNAEILKVKLVDTKYPFYVTVCYRAYKDVDMIETWTEFENREKKPVTLTRFDSGLLPVRRGDVHLSYFTGDWAAETYLHEMPLPGGVFCISNYDGVRNSHTSHSEVMLSLDGKAQENSGRVIGAALCYSGNYEIRVETPAGKNHRVFAGIAPDNSFYILEPKELFVTPVLAFTYSDEGLGGASRSFHRWARKYRLAHGDRERKILLNSWEGVYFDINEQGMDQMMGDIASMGGELFVMDDGWFGEKYPRLTDNCALGDWKVDRNKLPGGVSALVRMADRHGISFGIWIEPEMTNSVSELYEKHPDWIIKAPGRDPVMGRGGTQLVLDMSNPEVQDFVFKVVDDIMQENPDIDYIKWDANMNVRNHGSQYLPADRQSHLFIEFHRGFAKTCDRIRAKYPDLTIQACASGGGRANYGVLPWFDEFWVSDNTDALQRVYMQWGTSYFYPAIAMGSHISAAPNHQTGRVIPIKYRIDVAMSGRLGMEIQPKNMTAEEIALCRNAIAQYKQIRPVVQFGDIYRLISPYEGKNLASMMYCSEDKSQAVFYWWKLETFCSELLPRVRMAGLDPERMYTVHELNRIDRNPLPFEGKAFSGRYLMENGLEIPYSHKADGYNSDWSSRVLHLVAQ